MSWRHDECCRDRSRRAIIKSRGGRGNHNIHSKDMVEAARRVHDQTGFENYGVPFCMTAEVEPLGIQTDYGDAFMEPRVTQYTELSIDAIVRKGRVNVLEYPRMKAVVEAIDLLKNESIPVIGNITGHISTASSAVDPNVFFKSLIKNPWTAMPYWIISMPISSNMRKKWFVLGRI